MLFKTAKGLMLLAIGARGAPRSIQKWHLASHIRARKKVVNWIVTKLTSLQLVKVLTHSVGLTEEKDLQSAN